MTMWHCEKCLGTPGFGVGCVCAPQPAASAEPSDEEIIRIYSETLAEHVDGRGYRAGIIAAARALLSRYGRPAGDAQPVAVHQVFRSDGTWEDVDATARANCEDNGKETRTLYAAPVSAQKADDARDAPRYRLLDTGDIIQVGDEFIDDDCVTWSAVGTGIWVGMRYTRVLKAARRRIDAAIAQQRKEGV